MGRFDESIAQYRKALSIDPHFVPSHFGISADLMYQGKAQAAAADCKPWPTKRAMTAKRGPRYSAWR